jgi:hypothetical protein
MRGFKKELGGTWFLHRRADPGHKCEEHRLVHMPRGAEHPYSYAASANRCQPLPPGVQHLSIKMKRIKTEECCSVFPNRGCTASTFFKAIHLNL